MTCVFCKIVKGEEPYSRVYEDNKIIAFTPLRPTHPGEVVVIPKEHIDHFTDIPDELSAHLMVVAQHIGRRVRDVFNPLRVGYVVHGFGVAHAHLMVVPQHSDTDITSARFARIDGGKIVFDHESIPQLSREQLDEIAASIYVDPIKGP